MGKATNVEIMEKLINRNIAGSYKIVKNDSRIGGYSISYSSKGTLAMRLSWNQLKYYCMGFRAHGNMWTETEFIAEFEAMGGKW